VKIFFALLLSCSSFLIAKGQENMDPRSFDYSKADSIALSFPKRKYKSYTELVAPLTENLKTDHEKLRVLFRWITENIQYNYGSKTDNADEVVKSKKAVCIGYSTLLKDMCNSAGIECEVVIGFSKTSYDQIGRKLKKTDHAWNAVKLYGKWYLLDVTWATCYLDSRKKKLVKDFDELYFLTPPELFIKKHLPEEKKWQLLEKPVSRSKFIKPYIYYSGFTETQLKALQPENGIINIKLSDTLQLKFFSNLAPDLVTLELGNKKYLYYPKTEKGDDYFFIKQKFEAIGTYELTVFSHQKSIAAYKLVIKE
jgi:hypothetical protein